jgi:hypothetical protein
MKHFLFDFLSVKVLSDYVVLVILLLENDIFNVGLFQVQLKLRGSCHMTVTFVSSLDSELLP